MVDQALIEKLTALLKDHTEVCAAFLFGSRARGSHTSTSDVDIAVAFAPATSAWHEVELQEQLAGQLAMPVQIVDLARAGPHLIKAVSREGIPLVGKVPVAVEDYTSMGAERPEEAGTDPRVAEVLWLLESAADKVRPLIDFHHDEQGFSSFAMALFVAPRDRRVADKGDRQQTTVQ